jgi:hypothetical protein
MNYRRVAGQGIQTVFRVFLGSGLVRLFEKSRGLYPNLYPLTVVFQPGIHTTRISVSEGYGQDLLDDRRGTAKLASVKREFEGEWPNIWRKG